MLKAKIEIDNYTAHSCTPLDFIKKYILKDSECIKYDEKTKTAVYKNNYAIITLKNVRQI